MFEISGQHGTQSGISLCNTATMRSLGVISISHLCKPQKCSQSVPVHHHSSTACPASSSRKRLTRRGADFPLLRLRRGNPRQALRREVKALSSSASQEISKEYIFTSLLTLATITACCRDGRRGVPPLHLHTSPPYAFGSLRPKTRASIRGARPQAITTMPMAGRWTGRLPNLRKPKGNPSHSHQG